jgi:hypothetical protein
LTLSSSSFSLSLNPSRSAVNPSVRIFVELTDRSAPASSVATTHSYSVDRSVPSCIQHKYCGCLHTASNTFFHRFFSKFLPHFDTMFLYTALPVLASVSVVTAQSVIGVYYIPADDATITPSAANVSAPASAPSVTAMDVSSMPTPAPASSQPVQYGYTDMMPYSSMTQGGYQQMACGYGYARQNQQGFCAQQPWVSTVYFS